MKYLFILVLVIIAIATYQILQPKLQECPDTIAGNMMPGSGSGAYYLKNSEVRNISDYDEDWVKTKCKIEDKRVW